MLTLLGSTIQRQLRDLDRNGVQIRHSGTLERIHPRLQAEVRRAIDVTRENDTIILNVAFNYGGRDEIVLAVRQMVEAGVPASQITAESFRQYLHHPDLPDLDLVIRTGGEFRLSNFMLWQAAYAEYYSTETYWPAFGPAHLHDALTEFNQRDRRFGRIANS